MGFIYASRIACVAAGVMFSATAPVLAQTVQMFDDAPSIEQLRSIMIPESQPGTTRSIVIPTPAAQSRGFAASPVVLAPPNQTPAPAAVGFRINFAFNSANLPNSAHTMIDRVAQVMQEAPDIRVKVEGHTDAVGSSDYNVSLSQRRALSVAEYMIKRGVEPSRLMLIGKGMAEPLTQNRFDPANRRVQFVRVG
jgi:outer membrane protein OmpA-like peptidoglycan-associated protein